MKGRKANWIVDILRWNCLLKYGIEGEVAGEMEGTSTRERRRKHFLEDLNQ
jgi:hypothetical protein